MTTAPRVLVVDDEAGPRERLQVILANAGYEVVLATHGKEALAELTARLPDVIVCDVMMPVMDGFDLLKALRNDPATASVPFIMTVAPTADADYWRKQVSDYQTIVKPPDAEHLLQMIRDALSHAPRIPEFE